MSNFFSIVLLAFVIGNSNQEECLPPLKDCSRDKVTFFLYTGANVEPQELIIDDPTSLKKANFRSNSKFKFIVHGFTQSKDNPLMMKFRREYFKSSYWNLIYIDWNPVATDKCYMESAVPSAPKIGECAATLLKQLFDQRPEITIDKFHFIGFSLGAQICAQISNNLKPLKIPRITGCDPALTGSFFGPPDSVNENTLNKQHANFVDAILTNMGAIGVSFPDAHYNIYANDGYIQPGCNEAEVSQSTTELLDIDICSHARALQIFAESINSPLKFTAVKCDDKDAWMSEKRRCTGDHKLQIEVGEHCTPPKSENEIGIYHFYTNPRKPLAIPPPPSTDSCFFSGVFSYCKWLFSYLY
ncbi:pancreatic triacylglycerol lipase-like [Planococcus citri]|uniref:pancreatic triacylglycerol lipase-like n=1 Tax=Planococcus citri TaxID=170843 RepID=UPI0031F9F840